MPNSLSRKSAWLSTVLSRPEEHNVSLTLDDSSHQSEWLSTVVLPPNTEDVGSTTTEHSTGPGSASGTVRSSRLLPQLSEKGRYPFVSLLPSRRLENNSYYAHERKRCTVCYRLLVDSTGDSVDLYCDPCYRLRTSRDPRMARKILPRLTSSIVDRSLTGANSDSFRTNPFRTLSREGWDHGKDGGQGDVSWRDVPSGERSCQLSPSATNLGSLTTSEKPSEEAQKKNKKNKRCVTACDRCRQAKVRCERDHTGITCPWPRRRKNRMRACDGCKQAKVRCEREHTGITCPRRPRPSKKNRGTEKRSDTIFQKRADTMQTKGGTVPIE